MIGRRSSSDTSVLVLANAQMSKKPCKRLSQKILNQIIPEIKESNFYRQGFKPVLLETIQRLNGREVEQLVCYGLGTFHSGTDIASRYQLALLLMVYEELVFREAPISNVIEIFDPSFEHQDIEALEAFSHVSFHIIEENEHCARKITSESGKCTTLFYMPHLDKHFYNNLLGANWHPDCISRLVILGNSFNAMIEYETTSVCKTKLHYMNLLVNNFKISGKRVVQKSNINSNQCTETFKPEALVELPVNSDDVDYREIFNNFAFHFLDKSWLEINERKIHQHRLIDWDKVVSSNSDNESYQF